MPQLANSPAHADEPAATSRRKRSRVLTRLMDRAELTARVSEATGHARLQRTRRGGRVVKRVATLNERRLMEVCRLLMNVDAIDAGAERGLLDQMKARVNELVD